MPRDALSRNLQDGTLVVSDGSGTPKKVTLVMETGDLQWTVPKETRVVRDRGKITGAAHHRPGDDQLCTLGYSLVWSTLIGASTGTGNSDEFYEMVTNNASFYTSTSGTGQQDTLQHEFTVTSPAATSGAAEVITFAKVWADSVNPQEQSEANVISIQGTDFEEKPAIRRQE